MHTRPNSCHECTVRKSTIFASLTKRELSHIGKMVQPTVVKKKKIIYLENEAITEISLVKNGIIKVFKSLQDGRQQILKLCGLGDVLGLDGIFSKQHFATAQAVTDSTLCRIWIKDFLTLCQKQKIALKLLQTACQQLTYSQNQIFNLGARTAKERIAEFLLHVYNSQCSCEANPRKIRLTINRQEISELLGIKKETVVRILSQLKNKDIIKISGREILLVNIPELTSLVISATD